MQRSMSEFAGKVLLVTNVASQCGYTERNYRGLQALYEKYQARGFEVGWAASGRAWALCHAVCVMAGPWLSSGSPAGAGLPMQPVQAAGAGRHSGNRGLCEVKVSPIAVHDKRPPRSCCRLHVSSMSVPSHHAAPHAGTG